MSRSEPARPKPASSSNAAAPAPASPVLVRALVAFALIAAVVCWLVLRSDGPRTPRAPDTAESALNAAPAPPAQPPPVARAAEPLAKAPAASPATTRPAEPSAPPKRKYDPITEMPLLDSDDGVHIERTWGNPRDMEVQFRAHGEEFATKSVIMYAAKAAHFYQEAQHYGFATKVDETGIIRIYDPESNTYGEYNPDGTTRTFLRPEDGAAFFEEQPGVAPMQR